MEDVVAFLIEELGVEGVFRYRDILRENIDAFRIERTWDHFSQIEGRYQK